MTEQNSPGTPGDPDAPDAADAPGSPEPGAPGESDTSDGAPRKRKPRQQRKQVLLRLDPAMHDALARWAADELRSTNAQIDFLLRKALGDAGRLPREARPHPRRGRPPKSPETEPEAGTPDEP